MPDAFGFQRDVPASMTVRLSRLSKTFMRSDLAAGIPVTIREGWRLEQVADFLDKEGLVSGQEYRRIALTPDFSALEEAILSRSDATPGDSAACCPEVEKRWPFLAALPPGLRKSGRLSVPRHLSAAPGRADGK